ncbi:hypothetical protein HaLaN_00944 [Haematococcus lacustris]|uniref:Uncharacterized protein n=1 Tax=Haematococcus lacustris TaxID=44745 RepID=A0A699YTB6_HAELA|nr:hypothetical protein HaLaN_00944 [Haematococcus lacustris]
MPGIAHVHLRIPPVSADDSADDSAAGHAHSVTADTMKRLRLPQIAILFGAGVAASSDYRSGPKLQPRVKVSPKAKAINKLVAIMELPRGAPSLPEPWSHGPL